MTTHTKAEVVFSWNDVYMACRMAYPDQFVGFDAGSFTGVCWPAAIIFRQDRLDGLEPNTNPSPIVLT